MPPMNATSSISAQSMLGHFEDQILEQGDLISKKLHLLSVQRFPQCTQELAVVQPGGSRVLYRRIPK